MHLACFRENREINSKW